MNLEYLREFTVFAEYMNMTKAARELFISQPRLSQHLSALEAELGFPLMERQSGQRNKLTAAGILFYDRARLILQEYDEAVKRCRECIDNDSVSLSVSKPSLSVSQVFRCATREYKTLHGPKASVSIDFKNCIGMDPCEIVDQGIVNAAIIYLFPEHKAELEKSYRLIRLRSDDLYLLGPTDERFDSEKGVRIRELEGVKLAFAGDIMHQTYYNAPLCKRLKEHGLKVDSAIVFADDYDSFKMSDVEGCSLVPESWGRELAEASYAPTTIAKVLDADFTIDLFLIYRLDLLSPAQNEYLDVLARAAAEGA